MMTFKANTIFLIFVSTIIIACNSSKKEPIDSSKTDWIIANLLEKEPDQISIQGNPKLVNAPLGKAVCFDGIYDALFLDQMPLKDANSFTVEMIFKPSEVEAPFEQRIVHIGEVSKDRMLLEIRAKNGQWYFDGFVASNENKKALIDEKLTHPLGKWYHVALVVTPNSIITFVNGKKEIEAPFLFKPINTGKTSLGVRLNKKSWFKGSIYRVKISKKVVLPNHFIHF
ncbi:LamG domain-containing protein [Winogradskyella litoriviva]|uniref:LamG domain-containing protein n=1 Tax=Winogradskyella litoriviva TaxID=1220182 RepID=A0ABX2DZZ1_9FLAO|nr:LamG domain-containing protein [Winogradskyella litoriviva]NRD21822.1 LamG domain-containing protein [Winogradskyella litoriviva]